MNPLLRFGEDYSALEADRRAFLGPWWPFSYAPAWPLRWVIALCLRDGIRHETLSCGHVVRVLGRLAWRRRCEACYREALAPRWRPEQREEAGEDA